MNGLKQKEFERLQDLLEQRKASLLSQMADDTDAAQVRASSVYEIEASPADNASARTLNELVNEAVEHHAEQLRIINHALAKCGDGSYGICENCGEEIGLSRLNARPEARFCIACQTRMEKARK